MAVPNQNVLKFGLNPNFSLNVVSSSKGGLSLRNSWGTIEQKSSLPTNKEGVFEFSAKQVN